MSESGHPSRWGFRQCAKCGVWTKEWVQAAEQMVCKDPKRCEAIRQWSTGTRHEKNDRSRLTDEKDET